MNQDDVLLAQEIAVGAGLDPGPLDGIMGPQTRAALMDLLANYLGATSTPQDADIVSIVIQTYQTLLDARGFTCPITGEADAATLAATEAAGQAYDVLASPAALVPLLEQGPPASPAGTNVRKAAGRFLLGTAFLVAVGWLVA